MMINPFYYRMKYVLQPVTVVNPSFENNLTGWSSSGEVVVNNDESTAHSRENYITCQGDDGGAYVEQSVNLSSGLYRFTMYSMQAASDRTSTVLVTNNVGTLFNRTYDVFQNINTWYPISGEFEVNVPGNVTFRFYGSNWPRFDDFSLSVRKVVPAS